MVAAVLHLDESAGVAVDMIDRVRRQMFSRHDVADRDALVALPRAPG